MKATASTILARRSTAGASLLLALIAGGCASHATHPPIEPVEQVDLERFMGDWYVIAHIPTFVEENAVNAVESYRLEPDGSIATTFTFREGDVDGALREYTPTGYVRDDGSNAEWGMEFLWPFESEYLIVYLAPDYGETIIGRTARDYVWLMARTPEIPEERYEALVERIGAMGYDLSELRRVPQRWEEASGGDAPSARSVP